MVDYVKRKRFDDFELRQLEKLRQELLELYDIEKISITIVEYLYGKDLNKSIWTNDLLEYYGFAYLPTISSIRQMARTMVAKSIKSEVDQEPRKQKRSSSPTNSK